MNGLRFSCLLSLALLLSACNTAPVRSLKASADARAQTEEEKRVWFAARKFDNALARKGLIYEDPGLTSYVQSVGDALYPELQGSVRYLLVDSPDLNAFALGNGSIYFNTGLLARLDNEAQLATILAHEVTHFVEQHNLKHQRNINSSATAAMGITLITGIPLSGNLFAASAISGYSQTLEWEADRGGFARLVAQGYDAGESVKTFQHLLAEVEALEIDQPYFFSSHPKLEARIESFRKLIAEQQPKGSIRREAHYRQQTFALREGILQRYLDLYQYQTLILMLGKGSPGDRYPDHWPYFLGEAYLQRGETEDETKAEQALRAAISQVPDYSPGYRALGKLMMQQERDSEALQHFRRYLQLAPEAKDRGYVSAYIETLEKRSGD